MKVEESCRKPKETNRAQPLACRQIRRQIISVLKATHTESNRLATPCPLTLTLTTPSRLPSASVSCANRPKSCNSNARVGRDQSWHDFRHGSQPPVTYPPSHSLCFSLCLASVPWGASRRLIGQTFLLINRNRRRSSRAAPAVCIGLRAALTLHFISAAFSLYPLPLLHFPLAWVVARGSVLPLLFTSVQIGKSPLEFPLNHVFAIDKFAWADSLAWWGSNLMQLN